MEVDPDYETTNKAIRDVELQEEEDNKLTKEKLYHIIKEEFDQELRIRQKQIEEIEDKIFRAQKLLHIIRYVIISSYYSNKALDYDSTKESFTDMNIMNGQSQIHPAVKKLVGNNVKDLNFLTTLGKRKSTNLTLTKSSPTELSTSHFPAKKIKLESKNQEFNKTTCHDSAKQDIAMKRKKRQYRMVVGNLSYLKKSFEQDNLSHKWMVYVKLFRGSNEGPEVTNMIDKVIFYLHPSYSPHDVVEISDPPFHLSRRGWGEFPLRLQVFFKCPMNRPVNLLHQLKLNNTFTGRQAVGNETTVPIFLYDDMILASDFIKEEVPECEQALEHNYCFEESDIKDEIETSMLEHSYSLPHYKENEPDKKKAPSPVKQVYNNLIYGLGTNYGENTPKSSKHVLKVLRTASGQSIRFLPESFSQILLSSGGIVQLKLLQNQTLPEHIVRSPVSQSYFAKIILADNSENNFKIPQNKFKNMGEILPYLFKRLPLWIKDEMSFKHLFMAKSHQEFQCWNIGKKLASEWSRAKAIKKLLSSESYNQQWTTKAIFMYGRSHSYSSTVKSYKLFSNHSSEKDLLMNCFSGGHVKSEFVLERTNSLENISVDGASPEKDESHVASASIDASDPTLLNECAFIKEEALACGVVLQNENLSDGVCVNVVERMILQAVKCFADGLIRRSRHFLICKDDFRDESSEISCEEVMQAFKERQEFHAIKQFQDKKSTIDYFFK